MNDADSAIEFRIHGIGNHVAWSALGVPRTIPPGQEPDGEDFLTVGAPTTLRPGTFVESYLPPVSVGHKLWLLNWARTSRSVARLTWFLVIPITMINVAGHMQPVDHDKRTRSAQRMLSAAVVAASLLMSLSVLTWTVVLVETFYQHMAAWDGYILLIRVLLTVLAVIGFVFILRIRTLFRISVLIGGLGIVWGTEIAPWLVSALGWDWDAGPTGAGSTAEMRLYRWTPAVIGLGFALLVIGRKLTRREIAVSRRVNLSHAALFVLTGIFVSVWRPAQWRAHAGPSWLKVPRPAETSCDGPVVRQFPDACTARVDAVTVVVVVTTCLSIVLSALVLLAARRQSAPIRRPNLAGAALLIPLAFITIHALGSAARVSLEGGLRYTDGLLAYVDKNSAADNPAPFRTLTPFDDRQEFIYRIDLIVLGALAFFLCLGIAALLVWFCRGRDVVGKGTAGARVALSHRFVGGLAQTLGPTVALGLSLFVLVVVAGHLFINQRLPGGARFLIAGAIQAAAVVLALLATGRLAKARDVLQSIADVAGFWPVTHHPLAGASYRPRVLTGILREIGESKADTIVVVGHSQGSVLGASIVGQRFEADAACREKHGLEGKTWRLVTCGSPLKSLYAAFFPRYIDDSFFQAVRTGAQGDWTNFWRLSDPIATEVSDADNELLPDPRSGESRPRGHGDYWTDVTQLDRVAKYCALDANHGPAISSR